MEASRQPGERRRFALVAAGLLALCALGFAPRMFELGLLHDDWFYFHEVANGAAPIASPGGLRPLHGLVWRLCGALFGPAIPGYYLVLFALQWLAAALLYLLGRRYASPAVAAAFAALALLYPADASHLWLSSMPQRTAWLLALGAILCGEWARDRRRAGQPTPAFQVGMAPALALALASLAIYELHFFLLALWPAAAALLGAPWRRRQLLSWASIPALYLAWRFAWRPSMGGPTVVNTELLLDPVEIVRRGALLVPYNLFAEGWWIGLLEAFRQPFLSGLLFVAAAAACVRLVGATPASPVETPWWRLFAVAALVLVLGIAPVVPTTYWLGRTAGTFAARILAGAVPGAALLLLLALAGIVRRRAPRAAALAALLTLASAFHWNVARLAADNWTVQQRLAEDLRSARHEAAPAWPRESFLVLLDLPPNRLGYDTPWGMGRMIQQATGEATLSGIGIAGDRRPSEILTVSGADLRVHGGAFATVPLERAVFLRWQPGRLEPAAIPDLPGLE